MGVEGPWRRMWNLGVVKENHQVLPFGSSPGSNPSSSWFCEPRQVVRSLGTLVSALVDGAPAWRAGFSRIEVVRCLRSTWPRPLSHPSVDSGCLRWVLKVLQKILDIRNRYML